MTLHSVFEKQIETNKKLFAFRVCVGLAVSVFAIVILAITIFWESNKENLIFSDYLVLFIRVFASLAMYYQSDHYRKNIFILLPRPQKVFYITAFSGILYIVCIAVIVFSSTMWMFVFGLMMIILCLQNLTIWIFLNKMDNENPLLPLFKHWTKASFGYFCVIISISPLIYTVKVNQINDIIFPILNANIPVFVISDIIPCIIILSAMILSVSRLDQNLEFITRTQKKYYGSKNKSLI
jgi:hypothetical protein